LNYNTILACGGNMILIQGHDATCPHCWEAITLTLDLSVAEQSYIEDCPVCCKPLIVSYTANNGEVDDFNVEASD
jgi:hypothetical protein